MKSKNERNRSANKQDQTQRLSSAQDFERLTAEAEKDKKKKPGSQNNSSKQHNNGRGGGK